MLGRAAAGLVWWVNGLAGGALAVLDRLRQRSGPLLLHEAGPAGWTVETADHQRLGRIDPAGRLEGADGVDLARVLAGRRLVVHLAAHKIFRAELPALPAESRTVLPALVAHRLARIAPWPPAGLLSGFSARPRPDGQIALTAVATSRSFVAGPVAAAEAAAAREVEVVPVPAGPETPVIAIPLAGADRRGRDVARLVWLGLAGFLVVTTLAGSLLALDLAASARETEDMSQTLSRRLALLQKARQSTSAADPDALDAIDREKLEAPVVVVALEALSRALPDDTVLTSFGMEDGKGQISGLSRSLSDLVPRLLAAPELADATPIGATERLEDGSDRFAIGFVVRPAGTMEPWSP